MGKAKTVKYNVYMSIVNYLGEECNKELIATFYSEIRAKQYATEEQKAIKEKYFIVYYEKC